jgi:WD40 repeat protein
MKTALTFIVILISNTLISQTLNYTLLFAIKNCDTTYLNEHLNIDNINLPDVNGASMLMWAAYACDLQMVNYLVQKGANPQKKGLIHFSETATYGSALIAAAGEGKLAIVKYLIEECKINVDDPERELDSKDGWTALQTASYYGQDKVVLFLIEKGANISKQHSTGNTALHLAALNGSDKVVELLAPLMDVNIRNNNGNTPIHLASLNNYESTSEILVLNGANRNLKNYSGKRPSDLAPTKSVLKKYLSSNDKNIRYEIRLGLPIGHTGAVNAVSFSSDGRFAISGSDDKTIILWEVKTGLAIKSFIGHTDYVSSVCFSLDGKYIISGSADRSIKLWDINSGLLIRSFNGHKSGITSVKVSPNGKYMLSGSVDGTFRIWMIDSGVPYLDVNTGCPINDVCYSPDGRYVIGTNVLNGFTNDNFFKFSLERRVAIADIFEMNSIGAIGVWDIGSFFDMKLISYEIDTSSLKSMIYSICLSPDAKHIFTSSNDKSLKYSKFPSVHEFINLAGHKSQVLSVSVSPDGLFGISGSVDSTIILWELISGKELKKFIGHHGGVSSVCFSSDGKYILSGSFDKSLILWNVESGQKISEFKGSASPTYSTCFSPNGNLLYSCTGPDIKIWDIQSATLIGSLVDKKVEANAISITNNGKQLISTGFCDDGDEITIWDTEKREKSLSFGGNNNFIQTINYSPDGRLAISSSIGHNQLQLWFSDFGVKFDIFKSRHSDWTSSACFSPDGENILSGSLDSTLKLWSVNSGSLINSYLGHNGAVNDVCISHNGIYALSGSNDKTIKVWDIKTRKTLMTFYGHLGAVNSVFFSMDDRYVISGSDDKKLILWDVKTGKQIREFLGHTDKVDKVSFSPRGKLIASFSSNENRIRIWDVHSGKEIVSLIAIDDNNYIIVCPDQYFLSSKLATKKISYIRNLDTYSFEQFDLQYNRPDIILQRIGMADTALIMSYRKAYERRLKKLNVDENMFSLDFHTPQTEIINKGNLNRQSKSNNITLKVKFSDNQKKLARYNVWINNIPIYGKLGIDISRLNKSIFSIDILLELSVGENQIQVSCLNENYSESYKESVLVNYVSSARLIEPKLHFIGIGIDRYSAPGHNLNYSVKDITDLCQMLKGKFGDNLSIDTIFNENVTRRNVLALKENLLKTDVNDNVIISFSGHGLLSSSYDYYLSMFDINFHNPADKGMPYEDLEWLLDSIPARNKLLLIDACNSGEVDKDQKYEKLLADTIRGELAFKGLNEIRYSYLGLQNSFELMKELFADIDKGTGAIVISAAGGLQSALESNTWGNGAFTYSILKALGDNTPADTNNDGLVTVSELKNYVGKEVESLTDGKQKPTTREENLSNDFVIWRN